MTVKILLQDLKKFMAKADQARGAAYVRFTWEPSQVKLSYPDDSGQIVTVCLFESDLAIKPTISKTETL